MQTVVNNLRLLDSNLLVRIFLRVSWARDSGALSSRTIAEIMKIDKLCNWLAIVLQCSLKLKAGTGSQL